MIPATRVITVTTPPAPSILCPLATVKRNWSITTPDDDDFLSWLIAAVSQEVEAYCGRSFGRQSVSEVIYLASDDYPWQVPAGVHPLQLSLYPVTAVASVVVGAAAANPVTLDPAADFVVVGPVGHLIRLDQLGNARIWSAVPTTVAYSAGYVFPLSVLAATISFDVTAATITDSARGFSGFAVGDSIVVVGSPGNSGPWLVSAASARTLTVTEPDGSPASITTEVAGASISVSRAGTLPMPIQDAVMREVGERYAERDRDWFIQRMTIDGLGAMQFIVPGNAGDLGPDSLEKLRRYRVPVFA